MLLFFTMFVFRIPYCPPPRPKNLPRQLISIVKLSLCIIFITTSKCFRFSQYLFFVFHIISQRENKPPTIDFHSKMFSLHYFLL